MTLHKNLLVEHSLKPTTEEAILYWATQDEPCDADLILIEWNPQIYPTFRSKPYVFDSEQYEF
jgi:hypothetical protein